MELINTKKKNPKKLSFISIYFLGINGVIGSGAFLLPQVIYKDMDLASVLVLLCAAITVSMVALCYADLSSRFTGSGAAWLYSYNAFGRFIGYELGIFTWFLGCCTLSAEVVALLTTLRSFLPLFNT
ncbi:amino acid permease, partial [Lactobacillus intestinalis]